MLTPEADAAEGVDTEVEVTELSGERQTLTLCQRQVLTQDPVHHFKTPPGSEGSDEVLPPALMVLIG